MRLLILGSGGRLGTVLRRCWPDCGEIEPVWHSRTGGDTSFDIMNDPQSLTEAISACDAVLLLAGVTKETPEKPFSLNAELARATLNASGGKPVLLTSSAAIYGDQPGPLSEQSPLQPASRYGKAKADMERVAASHPNATCLRIGNVAGADALLGRKQTSYMLDLFPQGELPERSYIGPHALAATLAALAKRSLQAPLPKALNLACPAPVGLNELLRHAGIGWTTTPAPKAAIRSVHLDVSRLQGLAPVTGGAAEVVADWQRMEQTV